MKGGDDMSNKQKIVCIAIGACIAYSITSYFRKKQEEEFAEQMKVLEDETIRLANEALHRNSVKLEEMIRQSYK